MKALIIGYGLLGKELVNQTGWDYISRSKDKIDIRDYKTYLHLLRGYDTIVNCCAYTNTYHMDRNLHWDTNYKSVSDLVEWCNVYEKKYVHISTDYIYANSNLIASENDIPVHRENWYSYTKLLSDAHVQLKSENYLLVRCSHKPKPFPYENVIKQKGNFDYVDIIASKIIILIKKNATGVFNVGTEYKSMLDLALKTNKNVKLSSEKIHSTMPDDVSMDLSKLNNFLSNV